MAIANRPESGNKRHSPKIRLRHGDSCIKSEQQDAVSAFTMEHPDSSSRAAKSIAQAPQQKRKLLHENAALQRNRSNTRDL
ncbi:hypothetical protein [Xanthomonas oryzae]|uniref:hypothetical protein n=1 Tax=Xanthomonas oryzae TaxID=347 RepID=UPI0015B8408A|nr:hypothetical protein [Xanthomonas oryzae]